MSRRLRYIALVILAACLLVPTGLAAQDDVYTGCIRSADGSLYNVRQGTSPMAPCRAKDNQISWNMVGPQGPAGPRGLPGESCAPLEITVHCGEPGETIAAALEQAGQGPGQLVITVSGVCTEAVHIGRNNTTLMGAAEGAGLVSPERTGQVLGIGARDVNVDRLNLQGSVSVGPDSSVRITNSSVSGSAGHGVLVFSAFVEFKTTTVENNAGTGIHAMSSSTIRLDNCWIHHNEGGLGIANGTFALLGGGTRLTDNRGGGIDASFGSVLHFANASIENNGFLGVCLTGGSVAHFGFGGGVTLVRGHTGDGVVLRDTSLVSAAFEGGRAEITGNGGWGVTCSGPPAVAQIVGEIGIVSGNGAGQINCPISW